ncbi:DNA translocase SpoIIIE [bacterium BMS3Abin01]|nr:DNA translocase SpoIIIE [bacterium BMS3Abin01]
MARKKARYAKKGKKVAGGKRPRNGGRDLRHLRELGGLALFAIGCFMALVLYLGWSGGLAGAAAEGALRYLFGVLAYLAPPALIAGGVYLVFPEVPRGSRSFQAGLVLLLLSLLLFAGADTFSMIGGASTHERFYDLEYVSSHGGVAGDSLYWSTSLLIGDIGSAIAAVFMLMASLFLITGASVKAVLVTSGKGAHRAAASAGKTTRTLGRQLAERRTAAAGEGQAAGTAGVPFGMDGDDISPLPAVARLVGDGGDGNVPVNGASTYPDIYAPDEAGEPAAEEGTGEAPTAAVMEREVATAVLDKGDGSSQAELFPRDAEAEAYVPPEADMLKKSREQEGESTDSHDRVSRVLVETLSSFGIEANIIGTVSGPRVTRYELQLAPGIKVSRISSLKDDIAYALATTDIRILAPIPGKSAVGVEVPNMRPNMVTLGDIFRDFPQGSGPLTVWLGKDIAGQAVYADLAQMPHLLVAGTTGSGKSGSINCMVSSILLRRSPEDVRMILIDPKRVELSHFEGIPHLLTPVVTVMKEAANVLANLITEMESRYSKMQLAKARHLDELNQVLVQRGQKPLPYILLVVDELADLMMVAPAEVEDAIIRLAQKSRAVGIHLVLATQRPSVDVITGMIKANVPSRIAFAVSSQIDSRVILDTTGAESLLGQGDMLFRSLGSSKLQRIQGAYVSEEEIQLLTDRCKAQRQPDFREELLRGKEEEGEEGKLAADEDELLPEAMQMVVTTGTASVSFLQRRLRVGYTRAGRLIDMLEKRGVISGYEGSKPRRVLMGEDDIEHLLERERANQGPKADPGPDEPEPEEQFTTEGEDE